MTIAPQELPKNQGISSWNEALKAFRHFSKIPTPPPGIDSTDQTLQHFFSDPTTWSRIVLVPDFSDDRSIIRFPEPGFVFIKGLRGGNKSVAAIENLAKKTAAHMKAVEGNNGMRVWQASDINVLPKEIFQYDRITAEKMPITYKFILGRLGEQILPKQEFLNLGSEPMFFGSSG